MMRMLFCDMAQVFSPFLVLTAALQWSELSELTRQLLHNPNLIFCVSTVSTVIPTIL